MNGSILSNFPWSPVTIPVGINLIRPLLSIAGLFDGLRPVGPLVATGLLAILWISIAVIKRIEYPIAVVAVAGAGYAVTTILMAAVIQLINPGAGGEEAVPVPVLLTVALVSSLVMNVIWAHSSDWFHKWRSASIGDHRILMLFRGTSEKVRIG
jgi:hypothetical protein